MRVTSQYLYQNFAADQQSVNKELKRVSEQISSGKKIQNSYDDAQVYDDELRLDSTIESLKQIQDRTKKAQNFTSTTDSVMNQFDDSLRNIKTKLIAAANAPLNNDNRIEIANELEKEKEYLMSLANTKVGSQYIFSGTLTSTPPIDAKGVYQGNDKALTTLVGENNYIANSIDGYSLFLGSDKNVQKELSTNIVLRNQESGEKLQLTDTLGDMTGNKTDNIDFFLTGVSHDGKGFERTFTITADESVESLITKIEESYGNDATHKNVKVELNDNGNITVTDLKSGMSQLDMKLYGTQGGEAVEFIKSDFVYAATLSINGVTRQIDDSAYFQKEGDVLVGNVALIADGELVQDTTKLSEMASDSVDGKRFNMNLKDINGASHRVTVDLNGGGSTFSVDGTTYNIYNADGTPTSADDMTMGQLNNVIAMVTSDELPATNDSVGFNNAIVASNKLVGVTVNQSGYLEIKDKSNDLSQIEFSIYDEENVIPGSDDRPRLSFNSNNAITTQKAEVNFFTELDQIIDAVRNSEVTMDANASNARSIGIEKSIDRLDQLSLHIGSQHAKIGALEKSLRSVEEKSMSLEVNVTALKSELTDVDIAESYMRLNELSLNYQAILSSVTKINSLTLLNYMK